MAQVPVVGTPMLTRFFSANDGGVAVTFALLAVAFCGMAGLGLDLIRASNVSTKVSAGLDAAAIAGAKLRDSGATDTAVADVTTNYFYNFLASQAVTEVQLAGFNVAINHGEGSVTAEVTAKVPTIFARVAGTTEFNVYKSATSVYKLKRVELAMALDITGSMNTGGKLDAMKQAAKNVIETLLNDSAYEDAVRIALIPWSSAVNPGPTVAAAATNNTSFDNCVIERTGPGAASDAAPVGSYAVRASSAPAPNPYQYYGCPAAQITPLAGRSHTAELKDQVLSYVGDGGTAGHIGTAWGWYTIAPDWAGYWPVAARPAAYSPDTIKAVLLMTDGEFNMSYLSPGAYDAATQTNESYAQFQALCTSMKQRNVRIYTVGFQLSDPRASAELEACSFGSNGKFMAAPSNSELDKAFRAIAAELTALRITK